MRHAVALALVAGLAVPAGADTFKGFSDVDRSYLIYSDRFSDTDEICAPIAVVTSSAAGSPSCQVATGDVVTRLSIKPSNPQRRSKAKFAVSASGSTLTLRSKVGRKRITWNARQRIGAVGAVYVSESGDRVAVEYWVRQMNSNRPQFVVFDLAEPSR